MILAGDAARHLASGRRGWHAVRSLVLTAGLTLSGPLGAAPLAVHPENPRYFTDGTGRAVYLTGSHIWYTIQSGPAHAPEWNPAMSDEEFERFLDWLQGLGHNFTRLWTNWSYIHMPPYPWKRSGGGSALDGRPKFDLTDFDESYFDLLRKRIRQIERRGMYASVMFFGSHNLFKEDFRQVAWHPANNVNVSLAKAFDVADGNSFFTTDPEALAIQRALVEKTIDALNEFDNVLFEIMNEPGGKTAAQLRWHHDMVAYARAYEAKKYPERRHLIGMTGGHGLGRAMLRSEADWIAPDWEEYREGGPAEYQAKLVIADTDHLLKPYVVQPDIDVHAWRRWVWKSFLRGRHPILMDLYALYDPEHHAFGEVDPRYDPIRQALGHARWIADRMVDLARMQPHDRRSRICATDYCLVDAGREYLVYQPRSRRAFEFRLPAGAYEYTWYQVYPFQRARTGSLQHRGGVLRFRAFFSGDALLHLRRR